MNRRLLAGLLLACAACDLSPDQAARVQDPVDERPSADFRAQFEDFTPSSGIRFKHVNGASSEKLLPETMGSGAAFLDYDGDGKLDLMLVNGTEWPQTGEDRDPGRCALYRGRGDGSFEDVSRQTGMDVEVYGMGCAAADYDADGDVDLYLTALGDDLLLRNDGGTFRDVAASAGVGHGRWFDSQGTPHPEWTTAALWLDADGDQDLDLFVAGYCQWTPEIEIFTTLNGTDKVFSTPDRYTGLPPRLYLNRGDGTFEEAPLGNGEEALTGKTLGAATWDFDGDGRLDIVAANDTRPNFYFRSAGEGRFSEEGIPTGIAYDANGRARAGMGIDVGVLPQWGTVVGIGNFAGEPLSLYRRGEGGTFHSTALQAGLVSPTNRPLTFGLALLDLDLDGWLDLVVVNGHIEPEITRYLPDQRHAQSAQVFQGRPDGTFVDVTDQAGRDFALPRVGRGLAWGDVDGDGDIDLLMTQNGGSPALLRNRLQETHPRHFLRVDLRGPRTNPRAIGALVSLRADGRERRATVRTGSSYLSQGETTLTFGLGDVDSVERLEVRWPSGATRTYPVEGIDRTLVLFEDP